MHFHKMYHRTNFVWPLHQICWRGDQIFLVPWIILYIIYIYFTPTKISWPLKSNNKYEVWVTVTIFSVGPSPYSNQLNKSQNKSTNIQQTRLPNSDLWTPYSASASKDNVQSKMMPHTLPNIAFPSLLHLSQVTQVLPEVTKTQLHAFVLYKFHRFVVAEGTLSRLTYKWLFLE